MTMIDENISYKQCRKTCTDLLAMAKALQTGWHRLLFMCKSISAKGEDSLFHCCPCLA
jgi:hypothetical protein